MNHSLSRTRSWRLFFFTWAIRPSPRDLTCLPLTMIASQSHRVKRPSAREQKGGRRRNFDWVLPWDTQEMNLSLASLQSNASSLLLPSSLEFLCKLPLFSLSSCFLPFSFIPCLSSLLSRPLRQGKYLLHHGCIYRLRSGQRDKKSKRQKRIEWDVSSVGWIERRPLHLLPVVLFIFRVTEHSVTWSSKIDWCTLRTFFSSLTLTLSSPASSSRSPSPFFTCLIARIISEEMKQWSFRHTLKRGRARQLRIYS